MSDRATLVLSEEKDREFAQRAGSRKVVFAGENWPSIVKRVASA